MSAPKAFWQIAGSVRCKAGWIEDADIQPMLDRMEAHMRAAKAEGDDVTAASVALAWAQLSLARAAADEYREAMALPIPGRA